MDTHNFMLQPSKGFVLTLPPKKDPQRGSLWVATGWALVAVIMATTAAPAWAQTTTTVTRTETFDYDSFGQLIRKTVEPNDPALRLVTEYGRQANFGVVLTTKLIWLDPVSNATQSRTTETLTYDSRRRYATKTVNAKAHAETRTYDERTGVLLTVTDANALVRSHQYDGWGRKTRDTRPDGTYTTWAYRNCIDACAYGATSVAVEQDFVGTSQTTVPTEVFADSLGRQTHTRTWGFDGARVIADEKQYDSNGRLASTAIPRFDSAQPVWTQFVYDDLGRQKELRQPNASNSGYDTTYTDYNGLQRTFTNANNQTRTDHQNALDKLNKVVDANGNTTAYLYDAFGNLVRTTDATGNQIQVTYDTLGRKKRIVDPNLGEVNFSLNPLGQTWRRQDAKGQVTTYTYDELDRLTRRLEPDLDSRWVYDSATKGVGKLAESFTWANNTKDIQHTYTYDSLSRPSMTITGLDWDYVETVQYDSFGRPYRQDHKRTTRGQGATATGPTTSLITTYNAYGYASQLSSSDSLGATKALWTTLAQDARGRISKSRLGNGLVRQRWFNPHTERMEGLAVGADNGSGGVAASHQNDSYVYDSLGNLLLRTQLATTQGSTYSESLTYDTLNRLKTSAVHGVTKTYDYDAVGNITRKDGAQYHYPPAGAGSVRPHAHTGITGSLAGLSNPGFSYDANGNLQEGLGRRYTWSSFDQASVIERLSGATVAERTEFLFGPEHQRARQRIIPVSGGVAGAPSKTIYYGGDIVKEVDTATNTTVIRTYLPAGLGYLQETLPGTAVAATAQAPRQPRYSLTDRLGTPVAMLDDSQATLQRYSDDPWGRRRQADGQDDPVVAVGLGGIANTQDRTGYTGQEQLDQLALVHLNGRLYDPHTARMVSADPTVPGADQPQAFNRYSYVFNNALAYTDPSGFTPESVEFKNSNKDPTAFDIALIKSNCAQGLDGCVGGAAGQGAKAGVPAVQGNAAAAKGATGTADAAIQRYQQCGNDSGCIAAARTEMLGIRQDMRAAGVPLQERLGINANIAQASVLLGEHGAALDATAAVGIVSLTNRAGDAAKGTLAANQAAGKAAEARAAVDLVAEGNKILGSQVSVRTSEGRRVVDHLIQTPGGQIVACEVKCGGAVRNSSQLAKDGAMATEGGVLVGKNAPAELRGQQLMIQTIERRY
jgi:RHS repeat-associated protein